MLPRRIRGAGSRVESGRAVLEFFYPMKSIASVRLRARKLFTVAVAVSALAASMTAQPGAASESLLRLGPGDLIEISVYNVPELATKARIGSNGDVYLPLVDYVHIAGLTVDKAQEKIEQRLAEGGFVKDPHVTLLVDEFASQGASVLGEVSKPGVYPVMGEQHLFDVISAAGGLSDKAGRAVTITHRTEAQPVTLKLSRNLSDDPAANVRINPGDTVVVHRADMVYVVGDVGHPSGFLMENGSLTVLQALALAGGTNKSAKLGGTKIIRKTASGMVERPVELKKVLQAKAADIELLPDDILFVPSSSTKILGGRSLEAALQAAAAVSIVARP